MLNHSSRKLYFCIMLISLVFCVKELSGFLIGGWLLVGIIAMLTLCLPYKLAKAFVFFILPFTSSISGISVLCMYCILLFKSRKKTFIQFVPPILIALLELFNVGFYTFPVNYESVISYISFISLFFFLIFDESDDKGILLCLKSFILGVGLVLFLVYLSMIIQNGFSELLAGNLRNSIAMGYEDVSDAKGKLTMNANTIAYYSIVLFSILLLGYRRLSLNITSFYTLLCIAILSGLFSFSRTWLLLASVVLIVYVITSQKRLYIIIGSILVLIILYISQTALISSIFGVFTDRMNADTMSDAGGRIPIFIDYNKFWVSRANYILFGVGATHFSQIIQYDFSMHCGAQQIWVFHGIFGVGIYLSAIIYFSRRYVKAHKSILYYVPFFACLLFDQSIQFLVPYSLMFPFVPVAYILRLKDNVNR